MARRKTIEVEFILDKVNYMLEHSTCNQDFKRGAASVLEMILHETGNYAGFNYRKWLNEGYHQWVDAGRPDFPEKQQFLGPEYDRVYYSKPSKQPREKAYPISLNSLGVDKSKIGR